MNILTNIFGSFLGRCSYHCYMKITPREILHACKMEWFINIYVNIFRHSRRLIRAMLKQSMQLYHTATEMADFHFITVQILIDDLFISWPNTRDDQAPSWSIKLYIRHPGTRGDCDITSLIARSMGPTWGPSGADRTQVGPMLAPWTLLSGIR